MGFNADFVQELRVRVPISKLIATKVKFDQRKSHSSKGDFWGCCPFHHEKTPSFHCQDSKGRYYCFSCKASGDHFSFLMELEGLTFIQAVEKVASFGGIALPAQDPQIVVKLQHKSDLISLMECATSFFEDNLHHSEHASAARAYLAKRQIDLGTQRKFRLGYAPADKTVLLHFLLSKGFDFKSIMECGLLKFTDDGVPTVSNAYTLFRDRIMFPIMDYQGKVIAFGGRALWAGSKVKYLNSPETELFSKGKLLYNFFSAKSFYLSSRRDATRGSAPLLVVEGYMDVVKLAQAGFGSTVAILGTALTAEHLQLLWSVADTPVICFDGDRAGQAAAVRSLEVVLPLLSTLKALNFCLLPDGKDPDDFVSSHGTAAFTELISNASGVLDVLWQAEVERRPVNRPEAYANLRYRVYEKLKLLQDKSLKYYYYSDIKVRLEKLWQVNYQTDPQGFVERSFYNRRQDRGNNGLYSAPVDPSSVLIQSNLVNRLPPDESAIDNLEAKIFALFLDHPQFLSEFYQEFVNLSLQSAELCRLRESLLDIIIEYVLKDGDTLRKLLTDKGNEGLIKRLDKISRTLGYSGGRGKDEADQMRLALQQALSLHAEIYDRHMQN